MNNIKLEEEKIYNNKIKLKKKLRISIFFTVIIALLLTFNIYKVATYNSSDLFGDLGAVCYYINIYGGVILLYVIWLIFSISYNNLMIDKKNRKIPLIIMIILGSIAYIARIILAFY